MLRNLFGPPRGTAAPRSAPSFEPFPSGYLVAVEGGEGAGKSTQATALAGWLRDAGREVVLTREPGDTPVGRRLREALLDPASDGPSERAEALLYAADRAEHVERIIRPALERGEVVVTDRYIDSSLAYQSAGRGLPHEEVEQISRWATGGLVPHLTVVLDLPPAVGLQRSTEPADRLESEPQEFHERVRAGFLASAGRAPERYLVLDATVPAEELQRCIRDRLQDLVPPSGGSPSDHREVREELAGAQRGPVTADEREPSTEERERAADAERAAVLAARSARRAESRQAQREALRAVAQRRGQRTAARPESPEARQEAERIAAWRRSRREESRQAQREAAQAAATRRAERRARFAALAAEERVSQQAAEQAAREAAESAAREAAEPAQRERRASARRNAGGAGGQRPAPPAAPAEAVTEPLDLPAQGTQPQAAPAVEPHASPPTEPVVQPRQSRTRELSLVDELFAWSTEGDERDGDRDDSAPRPSRRRRDGR